MNKMAKGPKVYIIILNYKTYQDTIECLDSVFKTKYQNYEVIVVDNDSQNESVQKIEEWKDRTSKRFIFIKSDKNIGFAGGNNLGIKYALEKNDFEFLWLLNNDTVIIPDTLSILVEKADKYGKQGKKIGIIGSKLFFYDRKDKIQGMAFKYNKWIGRISAITKDENFEGDFDKGAISADYVSGASFLVTKLFINDIGLMSEDYFLFFEELDWIIRGKQKGYSFGVSSAIVYHKVGRTTGSSFNVFTLSELSDYYYLKNSFVLTKKFYPSALLTLAVYSLIHFVRLLLLGKYRVILTLIDGNTKRIRG